MINKLEVDDNVYYLYETPDSWKLVVKFKYEGDDDVEYTRLTHIFYKEGAVDWVLNTFSDAKEKGHEKFYITCGDEDVLHMDYDIEPMTTLLNMIEWQ
jgi:hypothetical protein